MNLGKTLATSAILWSIGLMAQEDQTAKAIKMGDGPFMSYVINQNGNDYTYAGINGEPWNLTLVNFHNDFKMITVKRPVGTQEDNYYPDEEAFPATYVYGRLNDRKEMSGYEYIDYNHERRLVITDEWVYLLEKFKNKDSYVIAGCLKKGELKGLKLTKAAFGAAKVMEKAEHKVNLQKYLDEAFAKQQSLLPEWQSKNQDKIEKRNLAVQRNRFVIDSINGKYWNSAEGKKKRAEWAQAKITIYNNTQSEYLMCHGQGVSTFLKPGQKMEFSCSGSGKVFKGERIPNNNTNLKRTNILIIEFNGTNCGATLNVSNLP